MRRFLITFFVFCSLAVWAQWMPDSLLAGYSCRTVVQPNDYQGHVVSTIIKLDTIVDGGRGALYIHGFNDYFFQDALADSLAAHRWNFRAVDLRRYGRSLRPCVKRFDIRSLTDYYQDIDSAIVEMQHSGIDTVVIIAHSTGGLIASMYMNQTKLSVVKGLILNSPFLDWNLGKFTEKIAIPIVSAIGKWFPSIKISQGKSTAYGESLLGGAGGEWQFDTSKKLLQSPPVTAGWIHAINVGQKFLHKHSDITVPILLMHSDRSVDSCHVSEGDAVLDVNDISYWGKRLGADVTEVTVEGAFHDMILSPKNVRDEVYCDMFRWLDAIWNR